MLFRSLLSHASRVVRPGGSVLMECADNQGAALSFLAKERMTTARVTVHQDLAGRDRVVEAQTPNTPSDRTRGTLRLP